LLFRHKHAAHYLAYKLTLSFDQPVSSQVAEDAAAMICLRAKEIAGEVLGIQINGEVSVASLLVHVRLPPTMAISDWMRLVKTSTGKALCNRHPEVKRLWTSSYTATTTQAPGGLDP
jgi:hypothetical protein